MIQYFSNYLLGSETWQRIELSIIKPLSKDDQSCQRISTICGIILTNGFEISGSSGNSGSLIGVFPKASMMNHDCVGNTRLVPIWPNSNSPKLRILASQHINKGKK
jgi:hypothetical protein